MREKMLTKLCTNEVRAIVALKSITYLKVMPGMCCN